MKYRDISLYHNNTGKYRIAYDYPISPSSSYSCEITMQYSAFKSIHSSSGTVINSKKKSQLYFILSTSVNNCSNTIDTHSSKHLETFVMCIYLLSFNLWGGA